MTNAKLEKPDELDEILDEIYQDKNTLSDLQVDRDIAKQAILAYMKSKENKARIDEIYRIIDSGRKHADGFGERAILVDNLESVLRNRINELETLKNLEGEWKV